MELRAKTASPQSASSQLVSVGRDLGNCYFRADLALQLGGFMKCNATWAYASRLLLSLRVSLRDLCPCPDRPPTLPHGSA